MQASTLPPYPPDQESLPVVMWYGPFKRAADLLLSAILLALATPIILICAGLIRITSSGPAFSSQMRLGRFGRPFRIRRLRTAIEESENASAARRAIGNDPRVTKIGQFLRRTRVNELPQLWNVLKGEISLIGPQPERPEFVPILESAIPNYHQRMAVRPGMTGLSQVYLPPGTGIPSVRKKIQFDLYYIREFGPLLDLQLLAASLFISLGVPRGFACRGLRLPQPLRAQQPTAEPTVIAFAFAETAIEVDVFDSQPQGAL
jgi:lipopolysaccharide/colanic/teichoic acid biosynthesis glycosyltransferase